MRRHEDRAGAGELLHAAGQVRALPDRRVVHGRSLPIERTTTSPELRPMRMRGVDAPAIAEVSSIALERLLHAQGGVAGAHGVILERDRCAEQRHDAVAHHLVHRALALAHGLHHQGEYRIEELPGLLGVAFREQLHRVLEVGEEDRDLLALAFERAAVGENEVGPRGGRR